MEERAVKEEHLTGVAALANADPCFAEALKGEPVIPASAVIASTAVIRGAVRLGENTVVKDFAVIEGDVVMGDNCIVEPHAVIRGPSVIGSGNHFYQGCSIGEACQDLKYTGEKTFLTIGDNNTFRENCSVHRGTAQGLNTTTVGSNNLFMVNTHVAHDCVVGSHCIFSNNATLAGHVTIGDYVIFGGLSAIHQFGRVGDHAFVAGMAALNMDVPPYVIAAGHYAKAYGINKVGLSRRGFSEEEIAAVKKAYMIVYHKKLTIEEAIPQLEEIAQKEPVVRPFLEFIKQDGRGIVR